MTTTPASTRRLANALLSLWDKITECIDDPIRHNPVAVLKESAEACAEALADVVTVEPLTLYREEE